MSDVHEFRNRLDAVRERIARAAERAGREPDAITLVGVSKRKSAGDVANAVNAGLAEVGENYVQEALEKIPHVCEQLAAGVRFVRLVREDTYDLVVANPPYQGTSKMSDAKYVQGEYKLAGRSFRARRINAVLEGNLLSRHKLFPITIEVDCVQSDEVPLQGLLEAEYRTEVTWSTDENGEPAISQETKTFALRGFGGTAVD